MKKFGLEQEFFLVRSGGELTEAGETTTVDDLILPDDVQIPGYTIPTDSCGYLVEARGEPHRDIYQAVYSLAAEIAKIQSKLPAKIELSPNPYRTFTAKSLHEIQRRYIKGLSKYNNLYGYINHKVSGRTRTAGLHLSITDEQTHTGLNNSIVKFYQNFDYVRYILKLDEVFASEIKAAKRNPGFYELKSDGRVEYRSLPTMSNYETLLTTICDLENMR